MRSEMAMNHTTVGKGKNIDQHLNNIGRKRVLIANKFRNIVKIRRELGSNSNSIYKTTPLEKILEGNIMHIGIDASKELQVEDSRRRDLGRMSGDTARSDSATSPPEGHKFIHPKELNEREIFNGGRAIVQQPSAEFNVAGIRRRQKRNNNRPPWPPPKPPWMASHAHIQKDLSKGRTIDHVRTTQITAHPIIHKNIAGMTRSWKKSRKVHSSTTQTPTIAPLLKGGITKAASKCKDVDRDEVFMQQYLIIPTQCKRPSNYNNDDDDASAHTMVRCLDGFFSRCLVNANASRDSQSQGRELNAPPARDAVVGRDA
jgi:hypothetical protein